jgi:hypothetical protein
VAAVTSAMVGTHWDISWHRSIGRDTFWTPAHVAIYMCGVLSGIACGYLIVATTCSQNASSRAAAVRVWGFRGPLGAFIAAWGGVAMLTSAPFDNWWHNAYGLDVRIISPPHTVLVGGMLAVQLGTLVLIVGLRNRTTGLLHRRLEALALYTVGMIAVGALIFVMEHTFRPYMHSGGFYWTVAIAVPPVLAVAARVSDRRWAATIVMAVYSIVLLGLLWILPLFPAEPKLAPVYRNMHQFIPPEFPLLVIAPAVAIDLLRPSLRRRNRWTRALIDGVVFVAVFLAVQYPFATFLMSPAARNRVLGTIYFDFSIPPTSPYVHYLFPRFDASPAEFWRRIVFAAGNAFLTTRAGYALGDWVAEVRR